MIHRTQSVTRKIVKNSIGLGDDKVDFLQVRERERNSLLNNRKKISTLN